MIHMATYCDQVQNTKYKMHVKSWAFRVKIKKMSHTYGNIPSTKSCKDWAFRIKIKKDYYDQIVDIHTRLQY